MSDSSKIVVGSPVWVRTSGQAPPLSGKVIEINGGTYKVAIDSNDNDPGTIFDVTIDMIDLKR